MAVPTRKRSASGRTKPISEGGDVTEWRVNLVIHSLSL